MQGYTDGRRQYAPLSGYIEQTTPCLHVPGCAGNIVQTIGNTQHMTYSKTVRLGLLLSAFGFTPNDEQADAICDLPFEQRKALKGEAQRLRNTLVAVIVFLVLTLLTFK